ncbi:MAG: ABC transporter permease [Oscillospiraceae bacterium]|nr:ABC transporter permease [Oscillospiraceae bacterium]
MVIFKLIKANIKHKKGAFKSIAALMAIITLSFTVTVSNNDNIDRALTQAYTQTETPDMTAFVTAALTDREIAGEIKENPDVVDVSVTDCIQSTGTMLNDQELYQVCYIYPGSHDIYRVFNENFTGYISEPAPLESGEIYIAYSLTGLYSDVKIGSELIFGNDETQYKFRVKGFVSEPNFGAAVIGTKRFFINPGDFEKMYANADEQTFLTVYDMGIDLRDGADCIKVKKALDDSCGISVKSSLIISAEETESYTKLYSKTGTNILIVFLILLVTIVIISMWHSITTSVEMEYVNLGILKSQGFTSGMIRLVYILQYLAAEVIGAVVGLVLSIPLTFALGSLFQPVTGLLTNNSVSFLKCIAIALGITALCGVFVILATNKVAKISPVRAISGGKAEVHFDNRLNLPIRSKPLSFFIGLRQFTSRSKSYLGTVFIVALLVYFMMTITVLSGRLSGGKIVEGNIDPHIFMAMSEEFEISDIKKFETEIKAIDKDAKVFFGQNEYIMADGIELLCTACTPAQLLYKPIDGRMPIYDNEAALTEIAADALGKKIGDTIKVGSGENAREFIITGYHQSVSDLGRTFLLTAEGLYSVTGTSPTCCVELSDDQLVDRVSAALDEKLGGLIKAKTAEKERKGSLDGMIGMIDSICLILVIAVFSVSIIFSVVVINMICGKAFIKERTDIGILKAVGFTARELHAQFAFRFLIISAAGAVIGGICSLFFTRPLLEMLLRMVGLTRIESDITFVTFIIPALLICLCFFLFSYIAAGKTRTVEVRELISE